MAQKPQEEVPPFKSKDSFESRLTDWQDLPDVQSFFHKSWLLDNELQLTLNMKTAGGVMLAQGLAWKPSNKLFTDNFAAYFKEDATHKFGFKATADQFGFKLDGGFRRSFNFNFNPYYELAVVRDSLQFKHMIFGFNYHDGESHTHHELAVSKFRGEYLLNFSNSFMMRWRLLSCCMNSFTSYGREKRSKSNYIITANLSDKLKLYAIKSDKDDGQGSNEDSEIRIGVHLKPSDKAQIILDILTNDFQDFERSFGAQAIYGEHLFGKFMVTNLSKVRFLLRYTQRQKLRVTANMAISESSNPERKLPKVDWGLRLDWQF